MIELNDTELEQIVAAASAEAGVSKISFVRDALLSAAEDQHFIRLLRQRMDTGESGDCVDHTHINGVLGLDD